MKQDRNRWEIIRDILKATTGDNKVKKHAYCRGLILIGEHLTDILII